MSPNRRVKQKHSSPHAKISRSRANAGSTTAIAGPVTLKQLVTIAFLPAWLVGIAVFDHAIADFNDQPVTVSIPIDVRGLHQEQDFNNSDNALLRHNLIPDAEGNLNGRIREIDDGLAGIAGIEKLEIVLLKRGKVQGKPAATDANGDFKLNEVRPGDYTLVASGPNGFLAYSVIVQTRQVNPDDASNAPQQVESFQYVSLFEPRPIRVENQDQYQIDAAAIPPKFTKLGEIVSRHLPTDAELSLVENIKNTAVLKPQEEAVRDASGFEFALNDEGQFKGRVSSSADNVSDMNIFLLQNDKQIDQTFVDKNGDFIFGNEEEPVVPGIYAVVAAGNDGFAALSIKLISADQAQSKLGGEKSAANEYYVSLPPRPARLAFTIATITDPEDLKYCRNKIKELNDLNDNQNRPPADGFASGNPVLPAASAASGPNAASSAGSGNSLAANGRLDRFLRLTAITAAIVAISIGDGADPPVMSPSQP